MKHLKKFNEEIDVFKSTKKWVLTTTSESSDHYIYFIEHHQMPTKQELEKFLLEYGNDRSEEDGEIISYEHIDDCREITGFKNIPN